MSKIISEKDSWKMFNDISNTYDKINRILSLGLDMSWRKYIAKFLPPKKNLKVLDLASGSLDQVIALMESTHNIESITALDLAEKMLEVGRKKIENKPYRSKIHFCVADAQKLPFPEESFDCTCFSFGIRNTPNPALSLSEIFRVLKPGGKCFILEFSIPPYPFKAPFLLYLRHILPKIGSFFSLKPQAYQYLQQTIETFPYGSEFAKLMKGAKFSKIEIKLLMFGAVSLYIGTKK